MIRWLLKVGSFTAKTIPSIVYIVQLNVFMRNYLANITDVVWFWGWLTISAGFIRFILLAAIPSLAILGFALYWFLWKDGYERQISKEHDENESRMFTVRIQALRMLRKYIPIAVIGITAALLLYFYKSNVIELGFKLGKLYGWFLLGETFRIVGIGIDENKRNLKELGL